MTTGIRPYALCHRVGGGTAGRRGVNYASHGNMAVVYMCLRHEVQSAGSFRARDYADGLVRGYPSPGA